MTATTCVTLASAAFGLIGSAILYRATYGLQSTEGGPWNSPELQRSNEEIRASNARRMGLLPLGFSFLVVSFLLQAAAALFANG